MEATRQRHRLISIVGIALIAALMLAAFAKLGGLGIEPSIASANAAGATASTSISVSPTCGSIGGFTGSVNLNGTFTGTITVGVFYHVPGTGHVVLLRCERHGDVQWHELGDLQPRRVQPTRAPTRTASRSSMTPA